MPIPVQSAKATNVGPYTNSLDLAFAGNNTAGNTIVVVVGHYQGSSTISVTDSQGNPYLPVENAFSTIYGLAVFYASDIKAGANTVTAQFSGGTFGDMDLIIAEYSGAYHVDETNKNNGTGTSISTGSVAASDAASLIVAAGYDDWSAHSWTTTDGYTQEEVTANPDATTAILADQLPGTTGAFSCTFSFTGTSSGGLFAIIAVFAPGAPAPFQAPYQGQSAIVTKAASTLTGIVLYVPADHMIIVVANYYGFVAPPVSPTLTDSMGTSFNLLYSASASGIRQDVFYGVAPADGKDDIALSNLGSSGYITLMACEYGRVSGIGNSDSSTNSDTSVTAGPIDVVGPAVVLTPVLDSFANPSWTIPSGFTALVQDEHAAIAAKTYDTSAVGQSVQWDGVVGETNALAAGTFVLLGAPGLAVLDIVLPLGTAEVAYDYTLTSS